MAVKSLTIGHLYPKEMNVYGDTGNVLVLAKRMMWRDIKVEVVPIGLGDDVPTSLDLIVSGGGQDKGQSDVEQDLQAKKSSLNAMAKDGVTMLLICGTYQLFGHRFVTGSDQEIKGIGVLDVETLAGSERMIGNVRVETDDYGTLAGYENHSGKTYLGRGVVALGSTTAGSGNNGEDHTEGAVFNNVFGTYLHGPVLPKNPIFADELIRRALMNKYGEAKLKARDDKLENLAKQTALERKR